MGKVIRLRKRAYSGPSRAVLLLLGGEQARKPQKIGGGRSLQPVAQRVEGIRSIANAELRDRLRRQTAAGKIFPRPGAFRRAQLLFKPGRRQLVQFEQLAALAVLLRLLRRGEFPLGQGDAALLGHDFDCFREADVLDLLHEGEDIARLAAAKTMVELAHRVHGKGRRFFPVKGAKTGVILRSGFLQRDVIADDPNNVRLLLYELGEVCGHRG